MSDDITGEAAEAMKFWCRCNGKEVVVIRSKAKPIAENLKPQNHIILPVVLSLSVV